MVTLFALSAVHAATVAATDEHDDKR